MTAAIHINKGGTAIIVAEGVFVSASVCGTITPIPHANTYSSGNSQRFNNITIKRQQRVLHRRMDRTAAYIQTVDDPKTLPSFLHSYSDGQ